MNTRSIFFWNHYMSWKIDFDTEKSTSGETKIEKFSLNVDKNETESFIRRVVAGPTMEKMFKKLKYKTKDKKIDSIHYVIRQSK